MLTRAPVSSPPSPRLRKENHKLPNKPSLWHLSFHFPQTLHYLRPTGSGRQQHGQVDHIQVPQLHSDLPTQRRDSYSVNPKNKLKEGLTIQESYIFTLLCSETLDAVHWLCFSLQVNLWRSQKLHYQFLIKENVSRQIHPKFIIFRYKDIPSSVNPLINNSDLL